MAANDGWDYRQDSSGTTGVGKYLVSSTVRSLMVEHAEIAVALYRDRVKKRSGANARDVRIHTELSTGTRSGRTTTRWVAYVTAYSPHALAREFGSFRRRGRGFTGEHVLRDVARDLETGF